MTPKIAIATPVHGPNVSLEYHLSLMYFAKDPSFVLLDSRNYVLVDLVRARSRMARAVLDSDCSHLWFVDADVSFHPGLLPRMLATGHDLVCAAYPRKKIRWDGVAEAVQAGQHPETGAYEYPVKVLGNHEPGPDGCVEVSWAATGMMLISRTCLEAMTLQYAAGLTFYDVIDGKGTPTVALFAQMIRDCEGPDGKMYPLLLGEDYSFCTRWRDMGGRVMLYVGAGSPAAHHGEHTYRWPSEVRDAQKATEAAE